jgi:hypothetical protein
VGAKRLVADAAVIDFADDYGYGAIERFATRIGDPTIMVRTPGLRSPLDGGPIEEIAVPLRWWRGTEPADAAVAEGSLLTAGALRLRYDAEGLARAA